MQPLKLQTTQAQGSNTNELIIILPRNTQSCDLLTIAIAWATANGATASVADSKGNLWKSVLKTDDGSGYVLQTFQAADISAGPTTITVTFSASVTQAVALVNEWLNTAATSSALDGLAGAFGQAGNPSAGNFSVQQTNELLYAVTAVLSNESLTVGSPWTSGSSASASSSFKISDEYQLGNNSAGTTRDSWTTTGSSPWLAQAMSFVGLSLVSAYASGGQNVGAGQNGGGTWDNANSIASGGVASAQLNAAGLSGPVTATLQANFAANAFQIPTNATFQGSAVQFWAEEGLSSTNAEVTLFEVNNGINQAANNPVGTAYSLFTLGGLCFGSSPSNVEIQFTSSSGLYSDTVSVSGLQGFVYYYIPVKTATSGNVSLYMNGKASYSTGLVPLFTWGKQPIEAATPLYIDGPTAVTSGIPLWLGARIETGMVPLYISGPTKATGSLPLYITGPRTNPSGMSLFVWGKSPISGHVPLYIGGPTAATGGITLFITTPVPNSGHIPLYIYGKTHATAGFNLFTSGPTPYHTGLGKSLYTLGSHVGTTGLVHETTLFVGGTGPHAGMNLFLNGAGDYKTSSMMNLFSKGSNKNASRGTTLFISNQTSGTSSETPLFVQGAGQGILSSNGQLGGYPTSGNMNLFLSRWPTAMTTLFIAANFANSGNVPLYLDGTNTLSSGMDLFMAGGVIKTSASQRLYTHGF